jgi:hypothetical protein
MNNDDYWFFRHVSFPFYAMRSTEMLLRINDASLAAIYLIMSFVAISLQKQLKPKSNFVWLSPLLIIADPIQKVIARFRRNHWQDVLKKNASVKNIVVPIVMYRQNKDYMCFCWIDRTNNEAKVFMPQVPEFAATFRDALYDGLDVYTHGPNSPAGVLSLTNIGSSSKLGEIVIDKKDFILPFKFEPNIVSPIWCIYFLIRRMGASSWEALVDQFNNDASRNEILHQLDPVVKATMRLMSVCIRNRTIQTYMQMFESNQSYGIVNNNMNQLKTVFQECKQSTDSASTNNRTIVNKAIIGIDVRSREQLGGKKAVILGGIAQRNDLTDKTTRDLMRSFIPKDPKLARFPVFRV